MVDPYQPALDAFVLTEDEESVVSAALKTDKPWDWTPEDVQVAVALISVKTRILDYHLQRHSWTCCYCRTNLHGAGPFMTDREHVLPKGNALFRPYSYAIWNLAAACKRCNMQFKRGGNAFVVDGTNPATFQSSENYRFVHPNFDSWEEHLTRLSAQANMKNIVVLLRTAGSAKADYTYDFFHLHDLQIDSFDQAQGLDIHPGDSELGTIVREIASDYGQ